MGDAELDGHPASRVETAGPSQLIVLPGGPDVSRLAPGVGACLLLAGAVAGVLSADRSAYLLSSVGLLLTIALAWLPDLVDRRRVLRRMLIVVLASCCVVLAPGVMLRHSHSGVLRGGGPAMVAPSMAPVLALSWRDRTVLTDRNGVTLLRTAGAQLGSWRVQVDSIQLNDGSTAVIVASDRFIAVAESGETRWQADRGVNERGEANQYVYAIHGDLVTIAGPCQNTCRATTRDSAGAIVWRGEVLTRWWLLDRNGGWPFTQRPPETLIVASGDALILAEPDGRSLARLPDLDWVVSTTSGDLVGAAREGTIRGFQGARQIWDSKIPTPVMYELIDLRTHLLLNGQGYFELIRLSDGERTPVSSVVSVGANSLVWMADAQTVRGLSLSTGVIWQHRLPIGGSAVWEQDAVVVMSPTMSRLAKLAGDADMVDLEVLDAREGQLRARATLPRPLRILPMGSDSAVLIATDGSLIWLSSGGV